MFAVLSPDTDVTLIMLAAMSQIPNPKCVHVLYRLQPQLNSQLAEVCDVRLLCDLIGEHFFFFACRAPCRQEGGSWVLCGGVCHGWIRLHIGHFHDRSQDNTQTGTGRTGVLGYQTFQGKGVLMVDILKLFFEQLDIGIDQQCFPVFEPTAKADETEWGVLLEEGTFTSVFKSLHCTVLRDIILLRKVNISARELDAYQLPALSTLRNHLLRAGFTVKYWFESVDWEVEMLDVTRFGFDEEGVPVKYSIADADLWGAEFAICQCKETKTGLRCSRRCVCSERGECSSLCGCQGDGCKFPRKVPEYVGEHGNAVGCDEVQEERVAPP